jgi:hypothetical protein
MTGTRPHIDESPDHPKRLERMQHEAKRELR